MRHLFYILVAIAVMCGAVACGKKHSPNKPKGRFFWYVFSHLIEKQEYTTQNQ